MREPVGIDSAGKVGAEELFARFARRVIETVTSGASRREAAELFEVAASTAVKWMQRLLKTGSSAAKPRGGSTSPLEEHAAVILGLLRERPDSTLKEMLAALG